MRPLTQTESRLLVFFGLALVAVVSLVTFSFAKKLLAGMDREIGELKQQKLEAEVWRAEQPLWETREKWLAENQPRYPAEGNPSSALLQKVQETASAHGLTITEQSLAEPASGPSYREVAVRVKVVATLEQLTRWLVELQQPAQFQAITSFSIRSDKEPPKIICEAQIARWYAP